MMASRRNLLAGFALLGLFAAAGARPEVGNSVVAAQTATPAAYPTFEVDASYPPKLPNDWVFGIVSEVFVDRQDHVWVLHRPRTVPKDKKSAPAVVELDAAGKLVNAWGGPGTGYDWPDGEHNIFVDHKSLVWISGSSP